MEEAAPTGISSFIDQLILWEIQPVEHKIDQIHDLDRRVTTPILGLLEAHDQFLITHERVRSAPVTEKNKVMAQVQAVLVTRLEDICRFAFNASNAIRLVDEETHYPDIRARNPHK